MQICPEKIDKFLGTQKRGLTRSKRDAMFLLVYTTGGSGRNHREYKGLRSRPSGHFNSLDCGFFVSQIAKQRNLKCSTFKKENRIWK